MVGGTVGFQAAEHQRIGDNVLLTYPKGQSRVKGSDFNYSVGDIDLSYGWICALAGAFYGNCELMGDAEQISDKWATDPESSINRFILNSQKLSNDSRGYLKRLIKLMNSQAEEVYKAQEQGGDAAQAYVARGDSYDRQYGLNTWFDYWNLALCNFDHFGQDAISSYRAGHTAALRKAKEASAEKTHSRKFLVLKQAYFLEAFASHFLTDLFSTGHMRTPRRVLHHTYTAITDANDPNFGLHLPYPADQCARKMHDEDCANGLWVSNNLEDSWPAYGDSELFSAKSNLNFGHALDAAQTGANDIWAMFKDGTSQFRALDKIPDLSKLQALNNYVPMFRVDPKDSTKLDFRSNLDQRDEVSFTTYDISTMTSRWAEIRNKIEVSGGQKGLHPLTLPILSPSKLLQFRDIEPGKMVISSYGSVMSTSADFPQNTTESWNMLSQITAEIPQASGSVNWTSAKRIKDNIYSLTGRVTTGTKNAYHVGLRLSAANNSTTVDMIWAREEEDDNSNWVQGDTCYGTFDASTSDIAMIKHWYSSMFGYQTDPKTTVFITVGTIPGSPASTSWGFATWSGGYQTLNYSTYTESGRSSLGQAIIPAKLGSDGAPNRLIRLFYGKSYSLADNLRIDVLELDFSSPSKPAVKMLFCKNYPITWASFSEEQYLTWFVQDVNRNGRLDLVGLIADGSLTPSVLVFPGQEVFVFGDPQRSVITSDKGTLFTAPFLKPLFARRASYVFPDSKTKADAAILATFSTYGVLGVRLIAPVAVEGSLAYEVKGQMPALAGQQADGLGTVTWRLPGEAIGIFVD
ncbi:hypothetical protein MMC17_009352 [Xylographa soralifera]|nr:hypothetical protein [Xylographa soralifera]